MTRWERRTSEPISNTVTIEPRCYGCFALKHAAGVCPECGYDDQQPRPPLALAQGTIVDRHYLIGRLIGGHSITGFTYLALDTRVEHVVMLREYLPRNLAGRNLRTGEVFPHHEKSAVYTYGEQMFVEEAQRLFKLNHPNLAKVRDLLRANNTHYVSMDYHAGTTVQQLLQDVNGILQPKEAMEIIMPLLDGLEAAHAQGCLHLDLNPNNVMLVGRRAPLLMGFAGAKHALAQRTLSLFTAVSAGYASPEQYYNHREVTQAADVYGVSSLLYTLLTGAIPPEAIERAETDTLVAPSRLHPRVPKFMNYAVMRGLAVNVNERPQSMADLRELLRETEERLVDIGHAGTQRPAPADRAPSQSFTWRPMLLGGSLLVGAFAALWAGKYWQEATLPPREAVPVASESLPTAPMSGTRSLDFETVSPTPSEPQHPVMPTPLAVPTPEIDARQVEQLTPAAFWLGAWPSLYADVSSGAEQIVFNDEVNTEAVATHLLRATTQLQAQQLDQPPGDNALESYRMVLALDAQNVVARAGVEAVLGLLFNRVEAALLTRDWALAEQTLDRLQRVAGDDARAAALASRLAEAKERADASAVAEPGVAPEQLARWLAQADVYVKQERFAGVGKSNALNKLNAILAADPQHAEASQRREQLLTTWRDAINRAMASKNGRRVDVLLEQGPALGVAVDEMVRWREQRESLDAKTSVAIATTVTAPLDPVAKAAQQRRQQAIVQQLGARAAKEKAPIVHLQYENGNRRQSAFAIASDGRFIHPSPVRGNALSFVWPGRAESVTVFFETKRGLQFEFDAPMTLTANDIQNGETVAPGVLWRTLYINDAHEVASTDNFATDMAAKPAVLALPAASRAPLGAAPIFVRSSLNDWRAEVPLEFVGGAAYTAQMPVSEPFSEFKFADADWSSASNFGGGFGALGLVRGGGARNLSLDASQTGIGQYQYALFTRVWPGHGRIIFHRLERTGELPANLLAQPKADVPPAGEAENLDTAAVDTSDRCTIYRAGPRQGIVVRKTCEKDEHAE